jgi:hypothetical protein
MSKGEGGAELAQGVAGRLEAIALRFSGEAKPN